MKSAFTLFKQLRVAMAGLLAGMLLCCSPGQAALLTWDPVQTRVGSDGGGTWDTGTTADWASSGADVVWAANGDAIVGKGSGAAATITVSGTVVADSLTLNPAGSGNYTFSGGTLISVTGTGTGSSETLTNNASTTINCPLSFVSMTFATSGQTLILGGGSPGTFGTGTVQGTTAAIGAASTVQLTGGNYAAATSIWNIGDPNALTGGLILESNSTINNTSGSFNIGKSGNGLVVINGGNYTMNATANTLVGRASGTGRMILQSGIINDIDSAADGIMVGYSTGSGELDIEGGTMYLANTSFLAINVANSTALNSKMVVSGGMVTTPIIDFGGDVSGGASGISSAGTGSLVINGGSVYVGSEGIVQDGTGTFTEKTTLSGGILGAYANWSSALPMTLTNDTGNITFQTANVNDIPFNITLSGALTGFGGLNATGGGTLTLTGTNTYVGDTIINGGTILVTGQGSLAGSNGFTITNSGALTLMNSASANNTNRISSTASITMDGGTFACLNDGSSANFSETAGALIINSGANTITVSPATNGQTSTLIFSSISCIGGSVNFQMGSVGTSQNRVFFTTPPAIGGWLTVNGGPAAYDVTNGLTAVDQFTDIAALGSIITNAPASNVRINSAGSGGNIQLGTTTTSINSLQQNTATLATVATANESFLVNSIAVNPGQQSLIIGAMPGDGVLSAEIAGGNLTLANYGNIINGLLINADVDDNLSPSALTVLGNGMVTLAAPINTYSGGTTISNGTLAVTTGTMVAMLYTNIGGTLEVKLGTAGTTLPMSGLTFGGNNPHLTFDLQGAANPSAPVINLDGNLSLNGNVYVNVTNPAPGTAVLLRYSGIRTGSGRFLPGNVPAGVGIVDNPTSQEVDLIYASGPTVIIPPDDTNAIVIAIATPQQYGAVGDGITDDSAAFQNAMNAVSNPGQVGGGVVYVPSGTYAFSNSITIPAGVTLQGDWTDWSQGTNGVAGTLFKVYVGAGQSNGTPFITISEGALKGVSIWYPNQDPSNITPYPFSIYINNFDTVVQDVALINSYQGISGSYAARHIISDVFGSPLYVGIQMDNQFDISHEENVRFSPDFWPASKLPGAPAVDGPHSVWMRANGVAENMFQVAGEACMDVNISGYNEGYYLSSSMPAVSFYGGYISNCATAFMDAGGGGNTGTEFTDFTLDGDIAVDRDTTNAASAYFHTCQINGRNGISIHQTGDNTSVMQFQNCNISGTVKVDGGIANFVNSSFTVPAGSNHCVMASGAIYAAFTGCSFTPARTIINSADSRRLLIDGRRASTSPLPIVNWSDVQDDWLTRRPAKLDLFFATNAVGDGTNDDTAAIQDALNTAGINGGGIVYLPPGKYKTTSTLDVPSGVELRGSYPSRHLADLYDGHVKVTVLQPYAGAGATNGPPAVALESNAGIVGLTITYELQTTNATPYPPTIQGRGANVYAYGVLCPNSYWYVDLNSYTCTNHFFYDVDGMALQYWFVVGNGSSGSIVDCMANWDYWVNNTVSASQLVTALQPPVQNFLEHNLNFFLMGDCSEQMVKDFGILDHTFMHCISQNNRGPVINGILTMCDASVECFRFESAANSVINIVNPEWMVTVVNYPDLTGYGVIATTAFQGKARFFNAPLWGGRYWDYLIQGGDVGFELTHSGYLSTYGSEVDGGVAHFINCGWQGNTGSFYTVPFNSQSNGVPGKLSEIIGCYAWTGVTNSLANISNPVNCWGNFGINRLVNQTVFNVTPPEITFSSNPANQSMMLTWTNNQGAFDLYSTTNLIPPIVWMEVTNQPYYAANSWFVTNSTANCSQQFFQLGP